MAGGTGIVSLEALNPIYANFNVPQQVMSKMRPGQSVRISTDGASGHAYTGRVNALESTVDESTRNVQVQATLANADNKLRPGMFVQVEVGVGVERTLFPLPASAINYAPFGDSVYIVTDLKGPDVKTYRGVRQQVVKITGAPCHHIGLISALHPCDDVLP